MILIGMENLGMILTKKFLNRNNSGITRDCWWI